MNTRQTKLLAVVFAALFNANVALSAPAGGKHLNPQTIISRSKNAVVMVLTASGNGTGFLVSPDGLVVTANHVVTSQSLVGNQILINYNANLRIVLPDERVLEAEPAVPGPPPNDWIAHDIALLRVREKNLSYLEMASWSDVEVGDDITAIGYAFTPGMFTYLTSKVSGREAIPNPTGIQVVVNAILFGAPINRGLSGAPLISNRSGKVVGIVSSRLTGVPMDLIALRDKIAKSAKENGPEAPTNVRDKAMLEVINVLDQSLVSGMGGAVAIDYARDALGAVRQQDAALGRH